MSPQEKKIMRYMETHGSITSLEAALKLNCLSLPQRIFDLRARGINIKGESVHKKNSHGEHINFTRYSLV